MSEAKVNMHTYWCRYFEPLDIPRRHVVIMWPDGMNGWVSGYRNDAKIFCARVDADSRDAAERLIRSCYGKSGHRIEIDSIDEHPRGWRPPSDRFPE
jgi:hypothetical protein